MVELKYFQGRGEGKLKLVPQFHSKKHVERQDYIRKHCKIPPYYLHDYLIFPNQLYNIFPWIMKYIPGSHQTVLRNWEKLKLFVSCMIDDHRKDWNPDEPRDFIDAFLKEMTMVREMLLCLFHRDNVFI